jgi:hypothetical protein
MAIQRITGRIIEDGAIEVADVADNAVTAAKIASGSITTAKIADGNVSADKLASTLDLTGKTVSLNSPTISGNTAFDTDTLYVNATDNNVGIGTSSPTTTLDVETTIRSKANAASNDSTVGKVSFYNTNASASANPERASIEAGRENSAWGAYLKFATSTGTSAATEAMRITSSGELLMNGRYGGYDSNSTGAITLNANAADGTVNFKKGIVFSSDGGDAQSLWAHAGITSTGSAGFNGNLLFGTDGTGTQSGTITERMRIASNGYLRIGCTSSPNASNIGVEFVPVLTSDWCKFSAGSTGGIRAIGFYNPNGLVGDITTNGSGTLFNTSSDYRLKENNVNITDGISRVKLLKPYRFNFIADASVTVDGFFAHEVQGVVPEAITKTKDAMRTEEYEVTPAILDDDGNVVTEAVMGTREVPDYQGIDQSKLVPLLTAALQEAITKIEDLETRIQALENA